MKFRSRIIVEGKSATGIVVPDEVVAGLGKSKHPQVRVTFNGYTYRTSVASMRGRFLLPVSAQVRKDAGVAADDEIDVEMELDTEIRDVKIPPEFANALAADLTAKKHFETLSYSNKRRYVLLIETAKTEETRDRRIGKTISELRAARSR